jgi:CubicO group peptidase (beta-lactamase class C family)
MRVLIGTWEGTDPRSPTRFLTMLLRLTAALLLPIAAVPAQFVPDVVTYVDVTSAAHQTQFTSLAGRGYRPISLSVAGSRTSPHYTAVWIRRSGPAFVGVHGVDAAAYETWRTAQAGAGFRPLLVSCAGPAGDEVYAGVYVADGVQAVERIEQIVGVSSWAYANDYVMTCASYRGTSTTLRYAGIWEENVDEDAWCWDVSPAAEYGNDFNARVDGYGRLVSAQELPTGSIAHLWRDSSVGGWLALRGLTSAQLQTEITNRRPSGWYPTSIQQKGTSIGARFEVVFAERDRQLPRTLTKTGLAVIPLDPFDQYMEGHVRAHGIRASAIAITKDARLVFARGYTFAETGQPQTQPTSLFRVASLSKTVTGLATNLLIQRGGTISQSTRIGSYLGLNGTDPNFASIDVLQLLQHRAGLRGDNSSWGVANLLNPGNPTLPVTSWQTAIAIALTSLQSTPGSSYRYSNLGYYLLGSAVERASQKTYERFIREDLGAPLGITRLWVGRNERSQLRSGEVEPRNRFLELTPSELYTDRRTVPVQFGGGGDDNLTRRAGAGGVLTSPVDYVRLFSGALELACDGGILDQAAVDRMLAEPDPRGGANPGGFDTREVRANGVVAYGKDGALWGSSTQFIYRSDGVAIAVFDGYQNSQASRDALNDLADAVAAWPTNDQFPSYGLPSFNRVCPRIDSVLNPSLPNLTDAPFLIDGDVFTNVDRVSFGNQSITSRGSTTWSDGWFRIVNDDRIELHPPQALVAGTYVVRLHNGLFASAPVTVTLTRATARFLGSTTTTFLGFDMFASRGGSSSRAAALLCYSLIDRPSVLQGVVSLDIGAGFSQLWTWPTAVGFNPLTGCARWQVPDFGAALLHFQAVVVDPSAINQPPFPVTNVRSVRGL